MELTRQVSNLVEGCKRESLDQKGKRCNISNGTEIVENITVIVTICADGTSLPPAVLFKGQAFQVKWAQDNPTKAS